WIGPGSDSALVFTGESHEQLELKTPASWIMNSILEDWILGLGTYLQNSAEGRYCKKDWGQNAGLGVVLFNLLLHDELMHGNSLEIKLLLTKNLKTVGVCIYCNSFFFFLQCWGSNPGLHTC
ncbi:hypothetical protein H1C71_022636, partial [Ictidomys tridecemlineatus]